MRKLVTIQKVEWISPIEKKDRIELIGVLGYQVITKKGEFQIGDNVIFAEPDSVFPDKPEFDFLRKNKFRIKTMKLGNVLSQGICFPLSILPKGEYKIGDDVTHLIGVVKYEPNIDNKDLEEINVIRDNKFQHPIFKYLLKYSWIRKLLLPKKQNKGFPEFISKTDETRCQNIPHILNNKDIRYIVREKLDGQSGTFYLQKVKRKWFWQKSNYNFGVCSRNLRLWNEDNSSYWTVAKKYNIESVLKKLIGDYEFVAIQGECIAPNVQGNKYKVTEPDLYVFNLIYPYGKVKCLDAESILSQYGIKWCPLIDADYVLPDSVNELLDYATGDSKLCNTLREGYVFRNYDKNISFKAVSPDFLISHGE